MPVLHLTAVDCQRISPGSEKNPSLLAASDIVPENTLRLLEVRHIFFYVTMTKVIDMSMMYVTIHPAALSVSVLTALVFFLISSSRHAGLGASASAAISNLI